MANSKTIVCNTNILIYFFSGNTNTKKIISVYNIAVFFISYILLQANQNQTFKEREIVTDFLGGDQIIEKIPFINDLAIKLRLTNYLKVPDAIIAATAKYPGASLASSDAALYKIKETEIIPFTK